MKKKIRLLSYGYIGLLIMLIISGMLSGVFSKVAYYLAFILPLFAICLAERREGAFPELFSLNREGVKITAVAISPCVCVVLVISYITSIAMYRAFGQVNEVDLGNSLALALINYAFLPALLEEMLFRYLPMRMLAPYSRRAAVLVSAFFFALIHSSLFSIPYAFAAGVVFMTVDLMAGSVIPSLFMHFINNAVSVLLIFYPQSPILIILFAAAAVSLVFIILKREEWREKIKLAFDGGEDVGFSVEMTVFALITLTISVLGLFGGNNG